MKREKAKAPLLHQLAGTTADAPPHTGSAGISAGEDDSRRPEAGAPSGFVIEVFSAEEKDGEIVVIEAGRGQTIRAKAKDAEILEPATGSKLKRVRLQVGKYRYD